YKDIDQAMAAILSPAALSWEEVYPVWKKLYYLRSRGQLKSDEEMFVWLNNILPRPVAAEAVRDLLISSYWVSPEHVSCVRRLKVKYKIGLLSNHIDEWLRTFIRQEKLDDLFDSIIISSAVRVRKPDAEIYYLVLRDLGVKPGEAVFVSDELCDDLMTAKGCGLKTVWFLPPASLEKKQKEIEIAKIFPPDATLASFEDLEKVVASFA
ncbi:MAG: HAD family hydrolase, partial [Patescibacteria group bacterium]